MMDAQHSATIFPEKLAFVLVRGTQPGCLLTIKNTGSQVCAFKIKTTEPKRYLVRPNQGLIPAAGQESVNVYVVEKECNALLDALEDARAVSDKFLVQTVPVTDEFFDHVSGLLAKAQADELARLWSEVPKNKLRSKKLPVEYRLAAPSPASASAGTAGAAVVAATTMASTAAAAETPGAGHTVPYGTPATSGNSASRGLCGRGGEGQRRGGDDFAGSGGGGGGNVEKELQQLRKKYDELVTYTAQLTETRNLLNRQLEDRKKALQREMAQRIALESKDLQKRGNAPSAGGKGSQGAKSSARKAQARGFSFWLLASVVVAVAYYGGKHSGEWGSGGGPLKRYFGVPYGNWGDSGSSSGSSSSDQKASLSSSGSGSGRRAREEAPLPSARLPSEGLGKTSGDAAQGERDGDHEL